jgi:SAM-dependent methyltransferase
MADWSGSACAVCGGELAQELLRINDPDRFERHVGIVAAGYRRSWVECAVCGAATNWQAPENLKKLAQLAAGYYEVDLAGGSIGDKYAKVMALAPEQSDNAQRALRVAQFAEAWLPETLREPSVLDIGAGTGVFLSRFLSLPGTRRWTGTGVEPDPVAAAHLRGINKFEVIEGLYAPGKVPGRFALVTLNKVVEHLPEPLSLLRGAVEALHPAHGVLYLELPDKLTVFHRPPSDNILGALHHHLYDPSSIMTLLERAGLVALRVERLFEPSGKISVIAFAALPAAVAACAGKSP